LSAVRAGAWLEPLRQRFPRRGVTAADVTGDDDPVLVEDGDGRVPVEREGAGELDVRVGERGPRPSVLADERIRSVPVVGDVQADELVLRMTLDEARVGDRLAVTDRSPGGPDVDEDRCAAKVGERERVAVECLPLERDPLRGGRAGGRVDGRIAARPAALVAPAAGEHGDHDDEKPKAPHHRSR
jgi:hypothetical protein